MNVFQPIDMTDAILTASNVTEDDYGVWSSGTDYAIGDYAISTDTHTVYRALVASGPGNGGAHDPDVQVVANNDPLIADIDPPDWQVISATNRWKAFDQKPSVATTNADEITYTFTPGEIVTGIAMFNLAATEVRVEMTDPTDGVVYDETIELIDQSGVVDWWTYFFEPFGVLSEFALIDLPPYSAATIDVTITRTGSTAQVGQIAFGRVREIGYVELKSSGFSGLDFSFVANDEFGNLTTTVRSATRLAEYDVVVDTTSLLAVDTLLRSLRGGTPAVWVGDTDNRKAGLAYGFHRNYRTIYSEGDMSLLNIQVQGIV